MREILYAIFYLVRCWLRLAFAGSRISLLENRRGGPECGYDRGKKVNGRKRHMLVDTPGFRQVVPGFAG
jgi:hypothetical protein